MIVTLRFTLEYNQTRKIKKAVEDAQKSFFLRLPMDATSRDGAWLDPWLLIWLAFCAPARPLSAGAARVLALVP